MSSRSLAEIKQLIVMSRSGTSGATPAQDTTPAGQQAPSDSARPPAGQEQQSGSPADSQADGTKLRRGQASSSPPWRVEGAPDREADRANRRRGWSRFLWILLVLLILNWILGAILTAAARPSVSYSFFLTQVNVNNVQTVTSTGDTIQGAFRHQVAYPTGSGSTEPVQQFTTERPTFANDNLLQKLEANGVTVSANPQGTPVWENLLLWFGPALLFGGLLYWWMRSGGAASLGGIGGMGRSQARRYDPGSAKRTTFADVAPDPTPFIGWLFRIPAVSTSGDWWR